MTEFHNKKTMLGRNIFLAAALALSVSGCARFSLFAPAGSEAGGAPKGILAAQGQGLLGDEAQALTAKERRQALLAEYNALEHYKAGQNFSWKSDDGRASGVVSPGQPYRVGEQNCRQYSHDWVLNGAPHSARGSACRNADGSWTPLT